MHRIPSTPVFHAINANTFSFYIKATIEDAEAQNDLSMLSSLKKLGIQLGAVTIARAKLETPEEIAERAKLALKYLPKDRLMLAPDCGLGFLKQELAERKLENMVTAARMLNSGY